MAAIMTSKKAFPIHNLPLMFLTAPNGLETFGSIVAALLCMKGCQLFSSLAEAKMRMAVLIASKQYSQALQPVANWILVHFVSLSVEAQKGSLPLLKTTKTTRTSRGTTKQQCPIRRRLFFFEKKAKDQRTRKRLEAFSLWMSIVRRLVFDCDIWYFNGLRSGRRADEVNHTTIHPPHSVRSSSIDNSACKGLSIVPSVNHIY